MNLSCIAIDDEPLALEVIKSHAGKIKELDLVASFTDPLKAFEYFQENPADLVLLDINMPDLNGIQLAKLINTKAEIVFTTAYSEYATDGFELAATDYLLKPIRFERFLKMISRVKENLQSRNKEQDSLFVKDGSKWVRIELSKLMFVQANDNYVVFQEDENKVMARMTLSEVNNLIPNKSFIQIHRSFIVNSTKINKIENHMIELNGIKIPVSRKYRDNLLKEMNLRT